MPDPPGIDPLPPPFEWPQDDLEDHAPESSRPQPHAYVEDAPEEPGPHARAGEYPPHSMDLPFGAPRPPYVDTSPNEFGIFRRYTSLPQRDPEEGLTTADFADSATHLRPPVNRQERNPLRALGASIAEGLGHACDVAAKTYAPFLNWSAFSLMTWQYTGSVTKSAGELQRLVDDVLLDPRFDQGDLMGFSATREKRRLDEYAGTAGAFSGGDGWHEVEVELHVPKERVQHESENNTESFFVRGIWARNLTEVLKTAFQDVIARKYHWFPHQLLRRRGPNAPLERVYSEVYNSDAMLEEHENIQKRPRNPEDSPDVEYVVAAVTVYSDSTHVAQFGTASLWPIHVLFANLSKYFRLKPTMFATHHLAYIPSLPPELFEWYKDIYGSPPSAAVIRLLKHDLMQKIWLHLLDAEFMHAFEHGILIKCGDGVIRRVFPRIFLYAADYPEKCLVACLKFLGKCACPECLIEKKDFDKMGTWTDLKHRVTKKREDTGMLHAAIAKAREWIFALGRAPEGSNIKATLLNQVSIRPTRSAFSIRFARFKQNCYDLFTPDLMHEFELGVWKSTFTHLVRILVAAGNDKIQTLDQRFSLVRTFGRGLIRPFGGNVSAMKKLAARDFEQLLICAIPVFEGLLPEPYNSLVLDLLFELAMWHAYAKLSLHTEPTLSAFEAKTVALGKAMRAFVRRVCPDFHTKELPRETQSRQRRKAASTPNGPGRRTAASEDDPSPKTKSFNTNTIKYHRLADYPRMVRRTGTSDNTNTQTGELEHRRLKSFYKRTNKNRTFGFQVAAEVQRQSILDRIARGVPVSSKRHRNQSTRAIKARHRRDLRVRFEEDQPLSASSFTDHHHMSLEQRYPENLTDFLQTNAGDPACKDFIRNLKTHLFGRLSGEEALLTDSEPTDVDLAQVRICSNRLYRQKVFRVNYTTYDMRRAQDSINPRTQPDIMMVAPDDSPHSYLYARVIGLFHVNAYLAGRDTSGMDDTQPRPYQVLWVRWFDVDVQAPGIKSRRLPRLKWARAGEDAFGFVNPRQVLRAAQLIPAFHYGQSDAALPGPSIARQADEDDTDWNNYYVGIFANRDMAMRYVGDGIGHQHTASIPVPPPEAEVNEEVEEDAPEDNVMAEDAPEDDAMAEDAPEDPRMPGDYDNIDSERDEDEADTSASNSEDEEEQSSEDEDDLGPEDGEDHDPTTDEYEYARLGYAPL
ncbi:hypothetical protein BD310DRAFT_981403 [Dichomitus squalens]|uniref:Uncharacterized protein n=1 Tax=Dichomitus squalens TaxID=114155 RepID=A0A4Q9PHH0_9APHY|nr:hypothetical protein BD310DRAFT_981403 [Dichomitus squalens]